MCRSEMSARGARRRGGPARMANAEPRRPYTRGSDDGKMGTVAGAGINRDPGAGVPPESGKGVGTGKSVLPRRDTVQAGREIMKPKPHGARRRTNRGTELRRTPKQTALRVAKAAARQPRLKEETSALEGVALLTGVLALFAFTIAASVVGVALLVASYWGEDRANAKDPQDEARAQRRRS